MTGKPKYQLCDGELSIEERVVHFPYPVAQVIIVDSRVIVRLAVPSKERFDRNVYALSLDGKGVWQIQEAPHGGNVAKPFMNLRLSDEGRLIAGNWIGVDYEVDLTSGQVSAVKFAK